MEGGLCSEAEEAEEHAALAQGVRPLCSRCDSGEVLEAIDGFSSQALHVLHIDRNSPLEPPKCIIFQCHGVSGVGFQGQR